jgi:hypothetical protein
LAKSTRFQKNLLRSSKTLSARQSLFPTTNGFYVFSIAPDIILHQRGTDDNNLLIVELKKDSNPEVSEYDNLKLECFTADEPGYEYRVGAKVAAHDQIEPDDRSLEVTAWYAEGVQRAEDEI